MDQREAIWHAHQRRRWMRPDAVHFIRPDAYRFMPPGSPRWIGKDAVRYFWPECKSDQSAHIERGRADAINDAEALAIRGQLRRLQRELSEVRFELKFRRFLRSLKYGYSPDQPRVPAGNPDGGQWTSGGGSIGSRSGDREELNAQFAQNRIRGRAGAQFPEAEPGQLVRLDIANARAQEAIRRVHELDSNWQPTPSLYGTGIESEIRKAEDMAQEAQSRASELARVGIGPGPFAGESLKARGPERDFTVEERREINRIGSETGCHTCGTREPGTSTRNQS